MVTGFKLRAWNSNVGEAFLEFSSLDVPHHPGRAWRPRGAKWWRNCETARQRRRVLARGEKGFEACTEM